MKAFEPYYGRTVAPPTDPNLLWDTRSRLDEFDVLRHRGDRSRPWPSCSRSTEPKDHGQVYALLDPAVERFQALDEEDRLGFKDALDKFVRTYSFLSQVVVVRRLQAGAGLHLLPGSGLAAPGRRTPSSSWTSVPRSN